MSQISFMPDHGHLDSDTPCTCDNCGWCGPLSNVKPIVLEHASALAPGQPVPAGECPACSEGAFVYLDRDYQPQQ